MKGAGMTRFVGQCMASREGLLGRDVRELMAKIIDVFLYGKILVTMWEVEVLTIDRYRPRQ